jgi:hypothetical protein
MLNLHRIRKNWSLGMRPRIHVDEDDLQIALAEGWHVARCKLDS